MARNLLGHCLAVDAADWRQLVTNVTVPESMTASSAQSTRFSELWVLYADSDEIDTGAFRSGRHKRAEIRNRVRGIGAARVYPCRLLGIGVIGNANPVAAPSGASQ